MTCIISDSILENSRTSGKLKAIEIEDFIPGLKSTLPETYRLLASSRILVHPAVRKITVHGSRGPDGGYHYSSDIDLCLVTDIIEARPEDEKTGELLKEVLQTSLDNSECPVELDLAAVFDIKCCGLTCFDIDNVRQLECPEATTGCMGLFKIQKGFNGYVPPITNVRDMYPLTTIWERSAIT